VTSNSSESRPGGPQAARFSLQPAGGLFAAWAVPADLAQAGHADEAAVRPVVGVDLPDAGVGFSPALLDHVGGGLGGAPSVGVEVVVAGGGGEQQQRFAEGVELKLSVDPIAGDGGGARVARELQLPLVGDGIAGERAGTARQRPAQRSPPSPSRRP
jgi:hypothetical protein